MALLEETPHNRIRNRKLIVSDRAAGYGAAATAFDAPSSFDTVTLSD
jgi:hypothetical protein